MTKVPPAIPMNVRRITRSVAVCTKPVQAVGMEAPHKMIVNKTLAPYLSQRGPKMNRTRMVPPTPAIDDVHTSRCVRPSDSRISGSSGEIANQIKKAIKKDHLEQQKEGEQISNAYRPFS